jgi:hypothetical protein
MATEAGDGSGGIRLGQAAAAESSRLRALLREATYIGGIFDLGYEEASVISNDAWVRIANGVPQHCFLLAAVREMTNDEEAVGMDAADREVILLRVLRETPLPNQSELVALRAEMMDRIVTERYQSRPQEGPLADVLTRETMQRAAFRCQVLGTFYEDRTGELQFGKDIDNIYAAGRYEVVKPWGSSLQIIVDHCELPLGERTGDTEDAAPNAELPDGGRFPIGTLRYSSTRRRELLAGEGESGATDVIVSVRAKDFVAHKTAVFGMTRAGKSNTMKVIATAVHQYAIESGVTVGQLIFDPTGEYAYPNKQDGTALFQIGDEVRVYRLGATAGDIARGFRPLSLNFFRSEDVGAVWSLICTFLRENTAQYIQNFVAVEPDQDTDGLETGDKRRVEALRAMLYACLLKAGMTPPAGWVYNLPMKSDLYTQLVAQDGLDTLPPSTSRFHYSRATPDQLVAACEFIATQVRSQTPPPFVELYTKAQGMDSMARMLVTSGVTSGWRILQPLRPFHSAISNLDYAEAIYSDLGRGRIVIVDLSRGNELVLQTCSERVVNHILARASQRFRSGRPPRPMQIFIEEAHRLLHREKFNRAATEHDPYVRLAKESAKYRIGMIYATQEVSSVDESILSNTANWIAAYMNNAAEAKRLASYYDFNRFTGQILSADDRGFIRLRTDSAAYTMPVQVRKFDLTMVNEARDVANLPPVEGLVAIEPEVAEKDDDDLIDTDEVFGGGGAVGRG